MPSTSNPDLAGFLDGMTSTVADNVALQSVRALDWLDPVRYLAFLVEFAPRHPPSREVPPRHEPFVL